MNNKRKMKEKKIKTKQNNNKKKNFLSACTKARHSAKSWCHSSNEISTQVKMDPCQVWKHFPDVQRIAGVKRKTGNS
jgi:hypothetical protein